MNHLFLFLIQFSSRISDPRIALLFLFSLLHSSSSSSLFSSLPLPFSSLPLLLPLPPLSFLSSSSSYLLSPLICSSLPLPVLFSLCSLLSLLSSLLPLFPLSLSLLSPPLFSSLFLSSSSPSHALTLAHECFGGGTGECKLSPYDTHSPPFANYQPKGRERRKKKRTNVSVFYSSFSREDPSLCFSPSLTLSYHRPSLFLLFPSSLSLSFLSLPTPLSCSFSPT